MCESLAKEVPMIISRPIPGQEEFNVEFLMGNDAAFRINKPEDIEVIITRILSDDSVLRNKIDNIKKIRKPNSTNDVVDFVLNL